MVQALARRRKSTRMLASSTHASALAIVFSKSLDRRRQRLSQASVRSTTQRLRSTMCNAFEMAAKDLGSAGMRLTKAQILRPLGEGEFPQYPHLDDVPINLERKESLIWLVVFAPASHVSRDAAKTSARRSVEAKARQAHSPRAERTASSRAHSESRSVAAVYPGYAAVR
jgi:hypothetical protein